MQTKLLTLQCPGCGAPLEITADIERFACGYCGASQIVQRRGGAVALKLVVDTIARVQAGTDATAAELAIRRISDELSSLEVRQGQLEVERSNYMGPWVLFALTGLFLLLYFISRAIEWQGAPVFLILVPVCALLGWCGSVEEPPFKKELQEIENRRLLLQKHLAEKRAIVE